MKRSIEGADRHQVTLMPELFELTPVLRGYAIRRQESMGHIRIAQVLQMAPVEQGKPLVSIIRWCDQGEALWSGVSCFADLGSDGRLPMRLHECNAMLAFVRYEDAQRLKPSVLRLVVVLSEVGVPRDALGNLPLRNLFWSPFDAGSKNMIGADKRPDGRRAAALLFPPHERQERVQESVAVVGACVTMRVIHPVVQERLSHAVVSPAGEAIDGDLE